jgi:RimJ/RimL family protein N-acetyltransferase
MIKLDDFTIINFNKTNVTHLKAYEELVNGSSKSKMISLIGERLLQSFNTTNLEFSNAYLITLNNSIVGYLYLSNKKANSIYLEMSILKQYRKKHIGSTFLNLITEYILVNNEDLKEIKLNIDKSNVTSMKAAINASYYYEEDDFGNNKIDFIRNNPYYIKEKTKKKCYNK